MANNLSLKVSADIADAQAKLAVLQAEFSKTQSQISALARAGASGSLDSAGEQQLRALTQRSLELQAAAQPLATSISEAGFAVKGFGASVLRAGQEVGMSHGQIATATREFRALFDELSSGRTRYTPGTLAIIAQRVLGLSGATLAAVGGVAALAGGLAYLAYRSIEASEAIDKIHLASLEAGNDISRLQFQQLIDQLARLPGVSESAAREIVTAFAGIHMPMDAFTAATRLASEQMRVTGDDAKKVGEAMAKALDPNRKAIDVAKEIEGLTQAQVDEAKAADRSQNANAILAEKLDLLSIKLSRARGATQEYSRSWGEALQNFMSKIGLANAGLDANKVIAEDDAKAWQKNAAAVRDANEALANQPARKKLDYDENGEKEIAKQRELMRLREEGWRQQLEANQRAIEQSKEYLEEVERESREQARLQREVSREKMDLAREEFEQSSEWLREYVSESDKAAKEQAKSWQSAVNEIEGAESALVNSVLGRRRSLAQAIISISADLVTREIQNDIRAATSRILIADKEEASKKALEEGGYLYHVLITHQKTAAEISGQSARTAAEATGNAARLASTASANASARAISSATGGKTVLADAAKAFSGTYASVAQIPYVGWILAPAAGAAAYAAVAAYEGLASLDVGAFDVPRDMVAQIHQGEMVVPKTFAEGLRQGGGMMSGGGESHHYHGDVNVSALDSRDAARMFKRNRSAIVQAGMSAYRRGAFR